MNLQLIEYEAADQGLLSPTTRLPDEAELQSLLGLAAKPWIGDLLQPALLEPIRYLTRCPGKRIRGRLVALGYKLAHQSGTYSVVARRQCSTCAEVIELIHAGSLVVDDIEDGSQMRRGQPALHRRYSLATALNAGNWLYFWPFRLIEGMELAPDRELALYRACHRMLLRAHFGQALDVSVRIDALDPARIPGVCLTAMELKTGALISLALVTGAILGGASTKFLTALTEFGHGLGVALQMFDDLGNLAGSVNPSKRFEDLALSRPSWVWAYAAENSAQEAFQQFLWSVNQLPDARPLQSWLLKHDFKQRAKRRARQHLQGVLHKLELDLGSDITNRGALRQVRELGRFIAESYD